MFLLKYKNVFYVFNFKICFINYGIGLSEEEYYEQMALPNLQERKEKIA